MAISVFLIFLTGVTSNSRRWEVVKISMSLKRPFFYLPGVLVGWLRGKKWGLSYIFDKSPKFCLVVYMTI